MCRILSIVRSVHKLSAERVQLLLLKAIQLYRVLQPVGLAVIIPILVRRAGSQWSRSLG